jgi:hypothetical protein
MRAKPLASTPPAGSKRCWHEGAAVADLREALEALIAEFGAPEELTVLIDVA